MSFGRVPSSRPGEDVEVHLRDPPVGVDEVRVLVGTEAEDPDDLLHVAGDLVDAGIGGGSVLEDAEGSWGLRRSCGHHTGDREERMDAKDGGTRATRIVATIASNAEKPGALAALLDAGVDVVRLNGAHCEARATSRAGWLSCAGSRASAASPDGRPSRPRRPEDPPRRAARRLRVARERPDRRDRPRRRLAASSGRRRAPRGDLSGAPRRTSGRAPRSGSTTGGSGCGRQAPQGARSSRPS